MNDRNTSLINGDRRRGLFEAFLGRRKNRSTVDRLGMNIARDEENAAAAESDLTIRYDQTSSSLATDPANYAAPEERPEFFGTGSMAEAPTADAADLYAEDTAILEFSSKGSSNCGEEWAAAKGKRTAPSDLMQHHFASFCHSLDTWASEQMLEKSNEQMYIIEERFAPRALQHDLETLASRVESMNAALSRKADLNTATSLVETTSRLMDRMSALSARVEQLASMQQQQWVERGPEMVNLDQRMNALEVKLDVVNSQAVCERAEIMECIAQLDKLLHALDRHTRTGQTANANSRLHSAAPPIESLRSRSIRAAAGVDVQQPRASESFRSSSGEDDLISLARLEERLQWLSQQLSAPSAASCMS